MPKTDRAPRRAGAGGTLRSLRVYRDLRMLLLGTLATNSAFWMYQVAAGWLALELTDSPQFVGLTGFAGGIPLLIVSLPAGVIIDRHDRRSVLSAAQWGVMLVSAAFAVLVGTGAIAPWSMLVLAAAYGTAMSFVFPTRTTMVPSLVARADLANAVALNAAGQNATRVLGPSLAGVLTATVGVAGTFAVAAAMQILALLTTSRLPGRASGPAADARAAGTSPLVGLRIVAAEPVLVGLILLALATNVLVMPYLNLMPVFARDELGLGSTGLGVLLGSTGLGTVAGALSVARPGGSGARGNGQIVAAVGFALLVLAFALVPVVIAAVPLLFAVGWASAAFLASNQAALQMRVAEETRGRVFSVYLLTWGMLPVGQLFVGVVAERIGAPGAMAIACLLALGGIAAVTRRFRFGPAVAPAAAPGGRSA